MNKGNMALLVLTCAGIGAAAMVVSTMRRNKKDRAEFIEFHRKYDRLLKKSAELGSCKDADTYDDTNTYDKDVDTYGDNKTDDYELHHELVDSLGLYGDTYADGIEQERQDYCDETVGDMDTELRELEYLVEMYGGYPVSGLMRAYEEDDTSW